MAVPNLAAPDLLCSYRFAVCLHLQFTAGCVQDAAGKMELMVLCSDLLLSMFGDKPILTHFALLCFHAMQVVCRMLRARLTWWCCAWSAKVRLKANPHPLSSAVLSCNAGRVQDTAGKFDLMVLCQHCPSWLRLTSYVMLSCSALLCCMHTAGRVQDAAGKVDLMVLCAAIAGKPYTLSPQVRHLVCRLNPLLVLVSVAVHLIVCKYWQVLHACEAGLLHVITHTLKPDSSYVQG